MILIIGIIFIFLAAIFLRLWKLEEFTMFLSDQGRDAIIMKRIVTLEHLPAIGAPSSIGQVYLGPFYYYLIAPFLLMYGFNPVGMSYGNAFLSLLGLVVAFYIIKKESGIVAGLIFLTLSVFSFVNIEASRFSWNPNLLPPFSFITLFFWHKAITSGKIKQIILFSAASGVMLAFSVQLHYLAGFLILPMIIVFAQRIKQEKHQFGKSFFISCASFITGFLIFILPLVIFDLRHNFLNISNLVKLFFRQGIIANTSLNIRLTETISVFFSNILQIKLPPFIGFIFFFSFIFFYFMHRRKTISPLLQLHYLNIFLYIIGFSFLDSARHPHYYGPVYFSAFYVVSLLFVEWIKKYKQPAKLFISVSIIIYVLLQANNYYFLSKKGANQILHSKKTAEFLADKIGGKPFNIATWPVELTEDNYLYFLELKGYKPVDRKKVEISDQMFVLCSKEPCQILDSPSWNISMFGKAKIDRIWNVEGIKIFKLVHNN